jgi:hypothetical protein
MRCKCATNKNKTVLSPNRGRHALTQSRGRTGRHGLACAIASISGSGGEWPEGPNTAFFKNLQRPDNDMHPYRDGKSRFCCGIADTVKTKFKVEIGNAKYPEDTWYAWLDDQWTLIPAEKIVQDHAPDGRPYLFMLGKTIQCFVRPKAGL